MAGEDQGVDRREQPRRCAYSVLSRAGRAVGKNDGGGEGGGGGQAGPAKGESERVGEDHDGRVHEFGVDTVFHLCVLFPSGKDAQQTDRMRLGGPDEVRAWTVRKGIKAPQAAGVIQWVSSLALSPGVFRSQSDQL